MSEPVATLGATVINVVDYELQRDFWTSVLGVEVGLEFPGVFCWFKPQHEGGPVLALQHVDDATDGTRRLHIDTAVDDLDVAQSKIEALGGSFVAQHTVGGFSWRIMHDPEDNEFCIALAHPG